MFIAIKDRDIETSRFKNLKSIKKGTKIDQGQFWQKSKKKNEAFSKGDLLDFGSSGGGPMGYTSQGGNGGARKKEKNRNEKMEYIQKNQRICYGWDILIDIWWFSHFFNINLFY